MSNELRALLPEDAHRHSCLMEQAFGQGRVVPAPDPDAEPPKTPPTMEGKWGVFESGELRAALTIVPFDAHWAGAATPLPLGGIAGVATFAEARGKGHVDALLRQALIAMRESGQVISALYPFAWRFYRRYGWDWVGEKRSVSVPLRELRAHRESGRVRDITGEGARGTITPLYTTFATDYRGIFSADSHKWESELRHDSDRTTYVFLHEGEDGAPGGYMLWRYKGTEGGGKGDIRALIANTPDAWHGLLGLLHDLSTQCDFATVTLPSDTPLYAHLMHWELKTKIEPVFMGRVVDVAAFLERLTPPADTVPGTLTLAVRDEHAPWNQGTWQITVEGGRVQCVARLGNGDAEVSLDIQTLSQACWGTPSLNYLRRAGRVDVRNENGYLLLSRLLPATPVYCMDYF